jgi:hypothetical protein
MGAPGATQRGVVLAQVRRRRRFASEHGHGAGDGFGWRSRPGAKRIVEHLNEQAERPHRTAFSLASSTPTSAIPFCTSETSPRLLYFGV